MWLDKRGIFVPWSLDCILCKKPETIDHVFIERWDAVFFWDVLKRTLKKDLQITPHTIRHIPMHSRDILPIDMFVVLGLYSIWRSRMAVKHADIDVKSPLGYFLDIIILIKPLIQSMEQVPDWTRDRKSVV